MTKFRSFFANALVEYIGVYSDTNNLKINGKLNTRVHSSIFALLV